MKYAIIIAFFIPIAPVLGFYSSLSGESEKAARKELLASDMNNLCAIDFFKHNFCVKPYVPMQRPEGTQVIVGSMNMGYISDTARNRTHNLFRPKREPIPLDHSNDSEYSLTKGRNTIQTIYTVGHGRE